MPHYHILIIHVVGDEVFCAYEVNLSEEEVVRIKNQFVREEILWFDGRGINSKRVAELRIFKSATRTLLSSQMYHQVYPKGYYGNFGGRDVTRQFITNAPATLKKEVESPNFELFQHISFLSLDENWVLATIALQLQEIAVTILSKRFGFVLTKQNVEKVLGKKVNRDLTFSMKYYAFSREVERLCDVKMPIMTGHLRQMRTEVLHKGYNPKEEETDAIVGFTTGFLQKLENIKPENAKNAEKL